MDKIVEGTEKTGEILRLLRRTAKLSLKDVGDAVGMSYQQIQKYESGVNRIPLALLPDFCDLFGVSAETFVRSRRGPDDDVMAVHLAMQTVPSGEQRRKIRRVVEILAA